MEGKEKRKEIRGRKEGRDEKGKKRKEGRGRRGGKKKGERG